MAYSSIMGADKAPANPSGRDADLLGPSDTSDSGSDAIGTVGSHADSDASGTGERGAVDGRDAREGADIAPDRIVSMDTGEQALASGEGFPQADADGQEYTDLDADTDTDADAADDAA